MYKNNTHLDYARSIIEIDDIESIVKSIIEPHCKNNKGTTKVDNFTIKDESGIERLFYIGHIDSWKQWITINKDKKYLGVIGDFNCDGINTKDFKNAPLYVSGCFNGSGKGIHSIKHLPLYIGGSLLLKNNWIKNLNHFPLYVGGNIDLSINNIKSIPENFLLASNGYVDLSHNELKSLSKNSLRYIDGDFDVSSNKIKSLENFPECVRGEFYIDHDQLNDCNRLNKDMGLLNLCNALMLFLYKSGSSLGFDIDNLDKSKAFKDTTFNLHTNLLKKIKNIKKEQSNEAFECIERLTYYDETFPQSSFDDGYDANNMNADALRSMLEAKLIVRDDNSRVADGYVGGFKI